MFGRVSKGLGIKRGVQVVRSSGNICVLVDDECMNFAYCVVSCFRPQLH